MKAPLHYTDCGLNYVFLENGFEIVRTRHGEGYKIHNVDALHETIARNIIVSPEGLRGQEVRFLRGRLNLSQEGLADILKVKRGTVARWESEPDKSIRGAADPALRSFYALKIAEISVANRLLELLQEQDTLNSKIADIERRLTFLEANDNWQVAQAA